MAPARHDVALSPSNSESDAAIRTLSDCHLSTISRPNSSKEIALPKLRSSKHLISPHPLPVSAPVLQNPLHVESPHSESKLDKVEPPRCRPQAPFSAPPALLSASSPTSSPDALHGIPDFSRLAGDGRARQRQRTQLRHKPAGLRACGIARWESRRCTSGILSWEYTNPLRDSLDKRLGKRSVVQKR